MEILYISRKSRKGKYSTLVTEEVESLSGTIVDFSINTLRLAFRSNTVIHAYLGGWRLILLLLVCGHKKLVVSLGGSEILGYYRNKFFYKMLGPLIIFLTRLLLLRADAIICVSSEIKERLLLLSQKRAFVVPKGVQIRELQTDSNGIRPIDVVLIPDREKSTVKNFELAYSVVKETTLKTLVLSNKTREEVFEIFSKAKCLLVVSKHEGSPNVVKEALYMGCAVVSLNVGDVEERIKDLPGCFISNSKNHRVIRSLLLKSCSLDFDRGLLRDRIISDELLKPQIARKIIDIYASL